MKEFTVAFIYNASNVFLTGKHFDTTYYHFFIEALKRNPKLKISFFPTGDIFDVSGLQGKFDVILLWENSLFGMPQEIKNIQDLDIPVIAKAGDPNRAKSSIKLHKKWKIDYYFHYFPEPLFYEWYPHDFKYKSIKFGIEPAIYQSLKPFNERMKNKILNSGAMGNKKIISRIINSIRNPKWNSYRYYTLRTKCNELPFVDYTPTLQHEFVGDKYPLLLQKYAAAIAATSLETTIKYWEIPSAGCLAFMEITEKNKGKHLGFVDGETAIFINEQDYKQKFEEYLSDVDNPKWEKIASAGKDFALTNFNNNKAAESLVELIKELV